MTMVVLEHLLDDFVLTYVVTKKCIFIGSFEIPDEKHLAGTF